MDDMKQPDDDGLIHIQRLNPEQFDIVLGTHPSKRKAVRPPATRSYGRTAVWLAVLGISAYVLATQLHASKPTDNTVNAQPIAVVPSEPIAVTVAPAQAPTPVAPASAAPSITINYLAPAAPSPDTCMKNGNAVVCRFGQHQPPIQAPAPAPAPQGMVSASYLADFNSDLKHSNTPKRKLNVQTVTATIRESDGRDRYQAQWHVFNNHIEENSVCFNFPPESTEHFECRKAAQVFFKEECRDWTKRWDNNREEQSKLTEQRYCTAAGSFNPAG